MAKQKKGREKLGTRKKENRIVKERKISRHLISFLRSRSLSVRLGRPVCLSVHLTRLSLSSFGFLFYRVPHLLARLPDFFALRSHTPRRYLCLGICSTELFFSTIYPISIFVFDRTFHPKSCIRCDYTCTICCL